jgi:hypothetical protein
MAIRAVVFDIGGVLELDAIGASVDIGLDARWEQRLGLEPGELDRRMEPIWRAGSLGECTEEDVHQEMGKRLRVQPAEMLFLDDSQKSVAAARALGIHAIHFRETEQAIADVQAVCKRRPDRLVLFVCTSFTSSSPPKQPSKR